MLSSLRRHISQRLVRTVPVRYGERAFQIPLIGGLGWVNRDPQREAWLDAYILYATERAGTLFVDVGVNLGQTLLKVRSLRSDIKYVGFEPNVTCAAYVTRLIELNRFENCAIVACALSSAAGLAELNMTTPDDAAASIIDGYRDASFYKGARRIVPTLSGDAFFESRLGAGEPLVVKIDVEGAELEVLQGVRKTIARARPDIVCEILPIRDRSNTLRYDRSVAIFDLLHSLDYRIFRLLPNGASELMTEVQVHGDLSLTNYAFVPKEREERFRSEIKVH